MFILSLFSTSNEESESFTDAIKVGLINAHENSDSEWVTKIYASPNPFWNPFAADVTGYKCSAEDNPIPE